LFKTNDRFGRRSETRLNAAEVGLKRLAFVRIPIQTVLGLLGFAASNGPGFVAADFFPEGSFKPLSAAAGG
jgi:hypothetical protein